MSVKNDYLRWVLEQLEGAELISSRRMFGGVGLYRDDVFFAIISDDMLYFKVDDSSRNDFERRGMQRFRPYKNRPHVSMNYYQVSGRCARRRGRVRQVGATRGGGRSRKEDLT
jgi:DNA transformation protein